MNLTEKLRLRIICLTLVACFPAVLELAALTMQPTADDNRQVVENLEPGQQSSSAALEASDDRQA
ncbi:hypothetical protein [Lignipirellula cremea]|uniref:Uncharacterized protein n=1 Tax=Lignipirellula cremea TaxID=2528010 RepID=A0A518DZR3_9BACT|nr:hypothetical protein [Lignipirellula cremea]QDU97305.1 hypothetical protein Pla8534_51510 [Lignipirellula cremea]